MYCIINALIIQSIFSGGREVYSQSKARSGRHKNRQRQNTSAEVIHHSNLQQQSRSIQDEISVGGGGLNQIIQNQQQQPSLPPPVSSSPYQQQQPCKVLKETVFSSEIHSIEYNSPMAANSVASLSSSTGSSSNDSPKVSSRLSSQEIQPTTNTTNPRTSSSSCKNINVDTGVIVFDDIKDCDVNVTYDLIEGEFPPPNISGLVVRDPNDLLTSDDLPKVRNVTSDGDVDSVSFGDEVDGRSEASSGGSKIIGDITIAEYEGSPRRYRPRATPLEAGGGPSPDTAVTVKQSAAVTNNNHHNKRPLKLPGFPQRVLPATPAAATTANMEAATLDLSTTTMEHVIKEAPIFEPPHQQEELLKFEDDQQQGPGGHSFSSVVTSADNKISSIGSIETIMTVPSSVASTAAADYDSKMRYEFSETRKVLDEFFQKDITTVEPQQPAAQLDHEVDLANTNTTSSTIVGLNNMPSSVTTDFSDLNYVLRKNNNYVGQRLAASEATAQDPNEISPELENLHIPTNTNNDLLLTSPTPPLSTTSGSEAVLVGSEPPNTLAVASLMVAKGPQLGVSPLDQPLVNFSNMASASTTTMTTNTAVTNQHHHVHERHHHKETIIDNNGDPESSSSPAPPVSNRGNTAPTTMADNQQQLQSASTLLAVAGGNGGCRSNDLESRNFTLSPETTDCDSADLESEMSVNEGSFHSSGPKMHTAMPVLEDGLSSGHASDLEDDVIYSR